MFRPMALTMAMALFGALVYAVVFFPAVLVTLVPPAKDHGPSWIGRIASLYARVLPMTLARRRWFFLAALIALGICGWRFLRAGAEFVPRIFEGDAVAAVGFIALAGIAVLNGIVMGQEIQRLIAAGTPVETAIVDGSVSVSARFFAPPPSRRWAFCPWRCLMARAPRSSAHSPPPSPSASPWGR
jgi:Cu/Ag efflux pump CusA